MHKVVEVAKRKRKLITASFIICSEFKKVPPRMKSRNPLEELLLKSIPIKVETLKR